MMDDPHQNFRNLVAADERTRAPWDATCDHIIGHVQTLLGVTLTREDVIRLPEAKISVQSSAALGDNWLDEARSLDSVKAHEKQIELKRALEAGEESSHAELSRLPRDQRISKARELGLESNLQKAAPSSIADEATLLRRCLSLSPQQRISFARANGLL